MLQPSSDMKDWLPIIRAEYIEFPGMHLTRPQIQRLWNLDAHTCDVVVAALEAERFLRRTDRNAYARMDSTRG
jgi:putative heme degradation protein